MTPAPESNAQQFGPYEVYERLGLGGMATVYRAKKRGPAGFERSVALKRMLSHLAEDPSFVESFVREAKVASLLVHPNIAQVYDFGRIAGTYYIAMELVAGFDVRKLLRYANRANEAIPLPVILSILGELCDALDYAHAFVDEHGQPLHIVHRDVSPSNMIVAHTGHLKVIDFGIAKANSRQLHTESGQVKGKLGYMSPEVFLGMPIGPVSDIFSVGVVAWELATALPLFSARTDFETMRKIREERVMPPSRFNPDCPGKLDGIILAALEREPEQRLASAREFRQALDVIAAEAGVQVHARAVSEWIMRFAQPDDHWARSASGGTRTRSPSGRSVPMPAEPPTAVLRAARAAGTQLRRSPELGALATEIWGDDVGTVADAVPPSAAQPDFHRQVAVPPQEVPARPGFASGQIAIAPVPAPSRPSKKPLAILGVLAVIAAALAGVLVWKRSSATAERVALRFEIEPANAIVSIAGKEIGRTSPLETQLAAGAYAMTVEQDGYEPYTSTITVREGEAQTIRIALERAAPEVVAVETPPPVTEEPVVEVELEKSDREPERTRPPRRESKRATRAEKPERAEKVGVTEPVPEPAPELPKPEPPKPEPRPAVVVKPAEAKPARTPVVAASAVTKLEGEVPPLRAKNPEGTDVLAKMCIDESGAVSSVKIVKSNPEIASALRSALTTWRYKPYVKDGKPSAVCFPLSLRVVVKSG